MSISITKAQLAELPAAEFDGNVRVIDSPDDIPAAIRALRSADVIGFDTETRPNFKKGQSHHLALIQLSTRSTAFLFRVCKTGVTEDLRQLLEDPRITKIGLSLHDDFNAINRLSEIKPAGFVELQKYAREFGITDSSLTKIYAVIFGRRISKSQRLSNWEADILSPAQQNYASLDAMACIEIYDCLRSGNFSPLPCYVIPAPSLP